MGKQWKQWQTLFSWAPKSLQIVTAAMKLKDACSLKEKLLRHSAVHCSAKEPSLLCTCALLANDIKFINWNCAWSLGCHTCHLSHGEKREHPLSFSLYQSIILESQFQKSFANQSHFPCWSGGKTGLELMGRVKAIYSPFSPHSMDIHTFCCRNLNACYPTRCCPRVFLEAGCVWGCCCIVYNCDTQ